MQDYICDKVWVIFVAVWDYLYEKMQVTSMVMQHISVTKWEIIFMTSTSYMIQLSSTKCTFWCWYELVMIQDCDDLRL